MTEHKPIFFDRVKAHSIRAHNEDRLPGGLGFGSENKDTMATVFTKAVPFVIDDEAVRKAMEVREKFLMDAKVPLIDLALVPFTETWIEYDPRAKLPPERVAEDTAQHVGHLIVRGPDAEGRHSGVSVVTFQGHEKQVITVPLVMNWSVTPKLRAPWMLTVGRSETYDLKDYHEDFIRSILLTGHGAGGWLPPWKDRIGGDMVALPGVPMNKQVDQWIPVLRENGGSLSLLMSILALIAWCPVELHERKPRGMFLHNRKPRAYMAHKVVTLHVPIRVAYQSIKRGMAEIVRKRRHRVREHFRVYNAGTPKEKRVLVHEHMRGDAALGYVRQEYEVTA